MQQLSAQEQQHQHQHNLVQELQVFQTDATTVMPGRHASHNLQQTSSELN